jgi:hypothetical protein
MESFIIMIMKDSMVCCNYYFSHLHICSVLVQLLAYFISRDFGLQNCFNFTEYFVIQFQAAKKKGKTSKSIGNDFIFVGIHARGTDHIKYELDRGFVPLKTAYYLDAMHMFRQHFRLHIFLNGYLVIILTNSFEATDLHAHFDFFFIANYL